MKNKSVIWFFIAIALLPNIFAFNFSLDMQPHIILAHQANNSYLDWRGVYNGTSSGMSFTHDKAGNVNNAYTNVGNSRVEFSTTPVIDTSHDWSISTWFNSTSDSTTEYDSIISGTKNDGLDYHHFVLYVNSNADRRLTIQCRINATLIAIANTTSDVVKNKWTHAVVTYNNATTNISIWIDNQLNFTNSNFNCFQSTIRNEWNIGSLSSTLGASSSQFWNGSIDEVFIFDKTLNSTEVNYLYNNFNNWTTDVIYVNDTTKPTVNFTTYSETSGSVLNRSYVMFNSTFSDNIAIRNATLRVYNSTQRLYSLYAFSSPFFFNITQLSIGQYYFNITAYDTSGNSNFTETRNVTIEVPINISFTNYSETSGTTLNRNYTMFNLSVTSTNAIRNITLYWYNSTGSLLNQSANTTSNPAFFNITNLANRFYFFNATVYDTSGNSNFTETRNVTIDRIAPFLINNSLSATGVTTGSTISIYADFNDTLSNISSLSVAIVDANNASVSGSPFSMSLLSGTSWRYNYVTSPTGTFYVRNYTITDGAGNVNVTTSNLSFIVNPVGSSGGGGGGGGTTLIQLIGTNETFTLLTETGGKEYAIYITAGGTREKYVVLKNTGSKKQKYTLSCEGTICPTIDYGGLDKTPTLDVNEQKEYTIKLNIPELAKHNEKYTGKIYLENEYGYEQYLAVSATVQPLAGAFFKYLEAFRGKSDITNKLGIKNINPNAQPVFLPNLLVIAVFEALFAAVILAFFKSTILRNLIFANGLLVILLGSVIWLA